jgi:hypothetical protein
MMEHFKIFVLPALLTLAMVAIATTALVDYLAQRSVRTTYVVGKLQLHRACALCHAGGSARLGRLIGAGLGAAD